MTTSSPARKTNLGYVEIRAQSSSSKRSGPLKGMVTMGRVHEALFARFWKCGGRVESRRRRGHSELGPKSVLSGACMACACQCQERIVSR